MCSPLVTLIWQVTREAIEKNFVTGKMKRVVPLSTTLMAGFWMDKTATSWSLISLSTKPRQRHIDPSRSCWSEIHYHLIVPIFCLQTNWPCLPMRTVVLLGILSKNSSSYSANRSGVIKTKEKSLDEWTWFMAIFQTAVVLDTIPETIDIFHVSSHQIAFPQTCPCSIANTIGPASRGASCPRRPFRPPTSI